MRALLVRGMLAGLIAAVLAALFAYLVGEPPVNAAIGLEEAAAHAAGDHSHEELVSRGVQSTLGLLTAVGVYGVAIGGLLAVAFAVAHGRLGSLRPGPMAALLTGAAFVAVVLVPFLKYPANPPAVGEPDTIGDRTGLYFGFVALSVVFAIVAAVAGRQVALRSGAAAGAVAGCAGYLVLAVLTGWLMPAINEVPADFPATTLWDVRIASLGTQVVLWTALAATFGLLTHRPLTPLTPAHESHAPMRVSHLQARESHAHRAVSHAHARRRRGPRQAERGTHARERGTRARRRGTRGWLSALAVGSRAGLGR